jgi:hypothetical protein
MKEVLHPSPVSLSPKFHPIKHPRLSSQIARRSTKLSVPLRPSNAPIPTNSSRWHILRRLQPTYTANPKLRATLNNTHNTTRTLCAILIQQLIIRLPARVPECIADTLRTWRDDTSGAIRTLPGVGGEAGHDVDAWSASAGLSAERGCNARAVHGAGEKVRGWESAEGDVSSIVNGFVRETYVMTEATPMRTDAASLAKETILSGVRISLEVIGLLC